MYSHAIIYLKTTYFEVQFKDIPIDEIYTD